jgi:hypothetical protein
MFCSIVLQTALNASYLGGNHLSTDSIESVLLLVQFLRESAPTIIWVSRSWGLPRSTLFISEKAPSLWHFYRYSYHIRKDLGIFPAVSQAKAQAALAYELARHEHYEHLSSCEHGLSSTIRNCSLQRLPERY